MNISSVIRPTHFFLAPFLIGGILTLCLPSKPIIAETTAPLLQKLTKPFQADSNSTIKTITKEEDNGTLIRNITVSGNQRIETKVIQSVISIREGTKINDTKIQQNEKNIFSLGSFTDVRSEFIPSEKGSELRFIVTERPLITSINFIGNTKFSNTQLRKRIRSQKGQVYNLNNTRHDIKKLEALYEENGYLQAKIYRIIHPNETTGTLSFYIAEGVIESLSITGNMKTKDYVIFRELELEPGDVIQEKEIKENIRRIFNLNYFTNVIPKFIPGETPNTYKLEIELEERETSGSFSFGGGYSGQSGFSLFSDLYWDNIFGSGQLIMLKGNFAFGSSQYNNRNNTYQFKYHNPWAWDKRKSFTFRTWLTEGNLSSVNPISGGLSFRDETRKGLDVGIGIPHTYDFRSSHTVKYEAISLNELQRYYNIYSYQLGFSYDTRDIRMNPREGQFSTFTIEQAFKFRQRALEFTQFDLDIRKFIPTFKKQCIALRSSFGFLTSPQLSDDDLFDSQWYYIGGGSTVRGYEDYTPFAYGNKKIISSVEYRFLFTQVFQLVLFIDAGNASRDRSVFDLSKFKIGKGVGVRLNVPPMGPVRLDFGLDEEEVSRLHFSMGHAF